MCGVPKDFFIDDLCPRSTLFDAIIYSSISSRYWVLADLKGPIGRLINVKIWLLLHTCFINSVSRYYHFSPYNGTFYTNIFVKSLKYWDKVWSIWTAGGLKLPRYHHFCVNNFISWPSYKLSIIYMSLVKIWVLTFHHFYTFADIVTAIPIILVAAQLLLLLL